MSKISEYEELLRQIQLSKHWFALLGSRYCGGGGGFGTICGASCTVTIYHQEYNGANNYHKIKGAVTGELDLVFKAALPELLVKAFANLEQKRIAAARLALDEHTRLLSESGLAQGE